MFLQSIPTCVGVKTITAIMEMTNIALEKKRCFLHATKNTHFTTIPFIVDINLLSYVCPHLLRGEHLPGARPARYFSINYPNFSPIFTLSWRSPPSRPHWTAHLPYKARCIIKQ